MKNQLFFFIAALIMNPALIVAPAYAGTQKAQRTENRIEKKQEVVAKIREKARKKGMKATLTGEITAISSDSLQVSRGDKAYTVYVGADTKLVRKFGGTAILSEFAVGNRIQVFGNWTDESKSAVSATTIRDMSIQKLRGTFVGKITAKGSTSFTIEPLKRTTQTVFVSSATKYMDRKKAAMTYADIKVGDQVKVSGVWDRSNNKIMEVTEVRDLSVPKSN